MEINIDGIISMKIHSNREHLKNKNLGPTRGFKFTRSNHRGRKYSETSPKMNFYNLLLNN